MKLSAVDLEEIRTAEHQVNKDEACIYRCWCTPCCSHIQPCLRHPQYKKYF